jgi:hypothetical protein
MEIKYYCTRSDLVDVTRPWAFPDPENHILRSIGCHELVQTKQTNIIDAKAVLGEDFEPVAAHTAF